MNMPEAIEMLQRTLRYYESGDTPRSEQAIKLGIEALKAIQSLRQGTPNLNLSKLPGETEETAPLHSFGHELKH